ncbi:transcription factor MYB41 [Brachypodium distachyon]|uniref:Uncharacterized protein n=1 Tax=Brachypodium distachyon TaxID=15368 RepID=I1J013_BRADI|nr:transcription factor MYB41 [Brachypodium distachyon]KQJ83761.1 hypothetical protein BRADI_5g16707v3 [Brachypodium distachyon]|eukprot:XP_003581451.1 transcription factor MYB41 [Brachypodium distachyon]
MGRTPCCDIKGLKKGPWTPEEDKLLLDYVQASGPGNWRMLPKLAGLNRCGKSCRLRWTNYLRPDIKRGPFTPEEHKSILQLHAVVGNKWSMIAAQLPGRTDNEIKNYWNTNLKKQLRQAALAGEHPALAAITTTADSPAGTAATISSSPAARHAAQWETARLEAEARLSLLSTSGAAAATATTSSSSSTVAAADAEHSAPDIFLRLWNSEVGDIFRSSSSTAAVAREEDAGVLLQRQEGVLLPMEPKPAEDSSATSNVTTAAYGLTADEYQVFLDMAAEDLGGFFHGGGFSQIYQSPSLFAEFQ